jgi:CheY-like chemotaxis protein
MSKRILVVDDEANVRRMMRLALESDGYEVEDAEDGRTGLERFGDGSRFDAVLLDQRMPGMDGIEALRQILRKSPGSAVVMVTAFGSIELAVEAMKAGARDFLKKPLTPALLRDAVRAALVRQSAAHETPAPAGTAAPPSLPITSGEAWTVNGFFIRSLPPADTESMNEHRFHVRHPGKGLEGDVFVTINAAEMPRIAKLTARQLPPRRAFWREQAERALMNYLFRDAALPPGNHLTIKRIPDEAVDLEREWRD